MSRSMCTVLVTLAIFQGAFAINVEPHRIINMELAKPVSPSADLFDGAQGSRFTGDLIMGDPSECNHFYITQEETENDEDRILNGWITIFHPEGDKVNYVSAVNKAGSSATICGDESILGSNMIALRLRFPPLSNTSIEYTTGRYSNALNEPSEH